MARQIDPYYDAEKFKHRTLITVRFADLDALAHVNHATYLTYMETARMEYAADVWGWDRDMTNLKMIVASAEVVYFAPLALGDVVAVYTRLARLGTKSFDLAYIIRRVEHDIEGQLVATGKTAMVGFDYAINQTIAVDEGWRQRSMTYEIALEGA
ncbi:MAG: acyl-CoA thioesterase [Chloroflexi bacterium]|nr:acyl-CoA thioesterase [Chloroflexota bacterium]